MSKVIFNLNLSIFHNTTKRSCIGESGKHTYLSILRKSDSITKFLVTDPDKMTRNLNIVIAVTVMSLILHTYNKY